MGERVSYYSFEELFILLVDDNKRMRRLLRTILQGLGCNKLIEADDGEHALHLLRHIPVDLALCDMMMTPMDGITFARRIRMDEASPNRFLPILMASAYSEPERVIAARDAGVHDFLAKPVSVGAVYQRIMALVERPRPFVRAADYFGPVRRGIDLPRPVTAPGPVMEFLDG